MNLQETQKLLTLIDSLYENWKPKNKEVIAKTWQEVFKDYTYEEVYQSFMRYYTTNTTGFAPVPGQLIAPIVEKRMSAVAPSESEAWSKVLEALGDSIYHSAARFRE